MDSQQKRWAKLQKQAAATFKPITVSYTISACPDCYGSRPQSNDSAWAKGCKECNLFDQCGKMTEIVDDASLSKKAWTERAMRFKQYMSPRAWERRFGKGWTGKLPT